MAVVALLIAGGPPYGFAAPPPQRLGESSATSQRPVLRRNRAKGMVGTAWFFLCVRVRVYVSRARAENAGAHTQYHILMRHVRSHDAGVPHVWCLSRRIDYASARSEAAVGN